MTAQIIDLAVYRRDRSIEAPSPVLPEVEDFTDRDTAIREIRKALKKRSGKSWSVTGGRGTAWGWITITAPPRRRNHSDMTPEDAEELASLLGMSRVTHDHYSVPASSDYRREFVARARGEEPTVYGAPYWD